VECWIHSLTQAQTSARVFSAAPQLWEATSCCFHRDVPWGHIMARRGKKGNAE
jgi:hypothetical protein